MAGPRRWPRRWGGLSSERCAVGWMSSYVERVPAAHMPLKPRLSRLDIELTERCNNDCIHCCINLPASDRHARSREMTTARVCDVIGEAAELGCLQVRLTGGEPLLRPDFEEIYLFARKLGLKVLIFTNARLISRHLADLLRDVPPLADIEVTVYGMHARSYDAVTRVPGSFAQFRRGVRRLLERRIRLVVKGALLPPNRGELAEFDQWAQSVLGMREAPGHSMFYDLRHRRDDPEKNLLIKSLRLPPEEAWDVLARDGVKYRAGVEEFADRFMAPCGDHLFSCGAGQTICVDAYGRAQPCLAVRDTRLTVDLRDSSLATALDRFKGLQNLRASNPEFLRRCALCFLRSFCEQCPAKSWAEHGSSDIPVEYYCDVAHTQARRLGWLGEGERAWEVTDWQERVQRRHAVG